MDRTRVSEYYARVTGIDIGEVARRLLADRLTVEQGHVLRFDCPHHESRSHASLIVDASKQAFWCKGCDVGGDVLHLVEFVQSGRVTGGRTGQMSDSHRRARDYLASLSGLPPLREYDLSADDLRELESRRQEEDAVFAVLADVAAFYHQKLLANAEALQWLGERYAIGRETIERLKIGFADNDGLFTEYLCKRHGWPEVRGSGAAGVDRKTGDHYAFFRGRIVFPYWKQGRVVYMIGRKTPWTPDTRYESPKYKKLPTRSEARSYISAVVQNDVFYNEDCLATRPDEVVITEGVTDCIALVERGVPCISPVTVCFRDRDHEKLLSLVRGINRVFICQDNEVSRAGLTGALKTARFLSRNGIDVRLVELPLGPEQQAARERLAELGITIDTDAKEIDRVKAGLDEANRAEMERLLDGAKIDLNQHLLTATADDFRQLMASAPRPFEWQIRRLDPEPATPQQRNDDIRPVLETLAELDPLDQDAGITLLQEHYGGRKTLPRRLLRDAIKRCAPQPPRREGQAEARPVVDTSGLRNYRLNAWTGPDGELETERIALEVGEIWAELTRLSSEWPRRVADMLFVHADQGIRFLENTDAFFAWAGTVGLFCWGQGQDDAERSLLTKREFFEHARALAQGYRAVEEMPHEPQLPGHYYAWRAPSDYEPTGEYFARLLGFFDNADTASDVTLIRALFMTPAWGGLAGTRPAFAIMAPDRGCGKSTLADAVGLLYGGAIEAELRDSAQDKLVSRLLTPEALVRRVVRLDNIKQTASSDLIENLITTVVVSGHRLYHGEASRPNTLTWILTGNQLRLSRDLADRSFIIRLRKPEYRPEWREGLITFIHQHRDRILADVLVELRQIARPVETSDRWSAWVGDVLARAAREDGEAEDIVRRNLARRNDCDEDADEAQAVMSALMAYARSVGRNQPEVFIPATKVTELINESLNVTFSARRVNFLLKGHIEAGRLPGLRWQRRTYARGYVVAIRPDDDA